MKRVFLAMLCILVCALPASAQGDADRYEVGLRLRSFETALDTQTDAAARKRILAPLRVATPAFFASQLGEVARQLDPAQLVLASENPPEDRLWASSLRLRPTTRLLDAVAGGLSFTCDEFYKPKTAAPEKPRLRLTLMAGPKAVAGPLTFDLKDLPLTDRLPLPDVTEGDYLLQSEILTDQRVLHTSVVGVAVVPRLAERLEKLQKNLIAYQDKPKTTDLESVRRLASLLGSLAAKKTLETDYPAARLLTEAEAAIEAFEAGKTFYGEKRPGQFWLTLVCGKESEKVRLQSPAAAKKGEPLPLVIALHGTGGSENLYFDANGHGLTAQLCEKRGWLLVGPDGHPDKGLVDAVDRLYPVDRKRVFLLGHSLGAMQAVQMAMDTPEQFAAVAALSGGVSVESSDGLRKVPFYVAAGSEDFGLIWATTLKNDLAAAKVKKVQYRELEGVEHLTVVQLALPEVFAFFDEAAKR